MPSNDLRRMTRPEKASKSRMELNKLSKNKLGGRAAVEHPKSPRLPAVKRLVIAMKLPVRMIDLAADKLELTATDSQIRTSPQR